MIYNYDEVEDLVWLVAMEYPLLVVSSGYFDPLHPGHVSCFQKSKEIAGDGAFVVILNGDEQCKLKKGKPFIPVADRAMMIDALEAVDHVLIYDSRETKDSVEPLIALDPDIYTKGGDRSGWDKIPEGKICKEMNIQVVFDVGADKEWSSSWYLEEWVKFMENYDEEA